MTLAAHADPPPAIGPDGPICPVTEMPAAWCGHCRNPHAGHRGLRDRLARRAAPPPPDVDVVRTFHLRYPDRCALCDRALNRGELVGSTVDYGYLCAMCL